MVVSIIRTLLIGLLMINLNGTAVYLGRTNVNTPKLRHLLSTVVKNSASCLDLACDRVRASLIVLPHSKSSTVDGPKDKCVYRLARPNRTHYATLEYALILASAAFVQEWDPAAIFCTVTALRNKVVLIG
jgi:hypothetical protein